MNQLKQKTITSSLSLFIQSGYSAVLGLAANLILTILLRPAVFGIYITVLAIIAILNYFSDIGLAASLIQKKEIDKNDIKTTFTIQQFLIITLVIAGFFATRPIINFYDLPQSAIYLYWALLTGFFISSLKTIPSVFLERKIMFNKIVLVQVLENTVFYFTVAICAFLGFGLTSFTIAVLLRAIIGLIAIYSLSPWLPTIGFSKSSFQSLISFGLPYQASSFMAIFKDDFITLYLGKVIGFEGLGYIGWAKKWAEVPIRMIMDNITRVLFPVLSRIQTEKERVSSVVDKVLRYQSLAIIPFVLGMILVIPYLVAIIPKYSKWAPALPLFYIFALASIFSSYSSPFINLFNALGKVKISFILMLFWTIAIWILTVVLTPIYGWYGFAYSHLIIASSFIIVLLIAKKQIKFNFIKSVYQPVISGLLMFTVIFLIQRLAFNNYILFAISVTAGLITYPLTLFIFFKTNIIKELYILVRLRDN